MPSASWYSSKARTVLRVPSWYMRASTAATSALRGCIRCTLSSTAMARGHSRSIARDSAVWWHDLQSAARSQDRQLSGETGRPDIDAPAGPAIGPIAAAIENAAAPTSAATASLFEFRVICFTRSLPESAARPGARTRMRAPRNTQKHRPRKGKRKRLQFCAPRVGSAGPARSSFQEVEQMRIRTSSIVPESRRRATASAVALGLAAFTLGAAGAPPGREADVVLRGGAVYTLDAVRSWAEAVAIRKDTILYVGPDQGVAPYVGPHTRVVNLDGRMVLPAFQDSHIHPISGGISRLQCALYDFQTKEEYVAAVARYAAAHKDLSWIRGDGWSLAAFAPTGIPDKALLDAIVSDRPVYLESSDGHSAWVNSKALSIAGITKDTPDPHGGRIDRDPESGEPLGSLQDSAMNLVNRKAPPYTPQERQEGLRYALKMLNGFGITSFQDASVDTDALETYRALDEKGALIARVVASLWWERDKGDEQIAGFLESRRKYTKGRLRATTIKIMQDGVMEVQTAAMLEPYKGKPGVRGLEIDRKSVV